MIVRVVKIEDYNARLDLAKEVEPIFGKMIDNIDFTYRIKECITNNSAFCVENNN